MTIHATVQSAAAFRPPLASIPFRTELVRKLEAVARVTLTQIVAPVGSGKTTLLAQLAAHHRTLPVAWLTIDASHNDLVELTSAIAASLGCSEPEVNQDGGLASAAMGQLVGGMPIRLLASLDRLPETVLVLDCLDRLQDRRVVEALAVLIEHFPPTIHVITAARVEMPLHLDRLRLRDQLVTWRQHDLMLTVAEVGAIVERLAGRRLTDTQLASVQLQTEGWPAAVVLAAPRLRGLRSDEAVPDIARSQPDLVGYFTANVLHDLPDDVRTFILQTSVLDELTAPLCEAMTGCVNSAEMQELLERRSVFVSRIDASGTWFRYHRLFRNVMREQLRAGKPGMERVLLQRAGKWHIAMGQPESAFPLLVAAEDWPAVAGLAQQFGRSMFASGKARTVLTWLDALPVETGPAGREVALQRATISSMVGRTRVAEKLLDDLESEPTSSGEQAVISCIRAGWVHSHGSPETTIAAADDINRLLTDLPPSEIPDVFGLTSPAYLRAAADLCRGSALRYLGDTEEGRRVLNTLTEQAVPHASLLADIHAELALLEAWSGNLARAEQAASRAFKTAADDDRRRTAPVAAHLAMAHVLIERNFVRRAEVALASVLATAGRTLTPSQRTIHATDVALALLASDDVQGALDVLDGLPLASSGVALSRLSSFARATRARVLLAAGRIADSATVADIRAEPGHPEIVAAATWAAIAAHDAPTAEHLVAIWPHHRGELRPQLERELCRAALADMKGDERLAVELVATAVAMAEPEGHVRVFVDAVSGITRLLRLQFHREPTPYLRLLVDAADAAQPQRLGRAHLPLLVASPTRRELIVLGALVSRRSNADIADELGITVNTLKTHLRTLYRKLGVRSRRDAVAEAERLGLF